MPDSPGSQPRVSATCAFCQIIRGEQQAALVFEDRVSLAFLDRRPLFPGHCLLIPREHFETLADLPADLVGLLFRNAQLLERAIEEGLQPGTSISHEGFLAAIHPDDREYVDHITNQGLASHTEFYTDYRIIWPDGSIHWLTDRGRGIYNAQGRPVHIIGAVMDITRLKHAEEALRESEGRFRRFVESNLIGITVSDLEGTIREANDAFLALVGYIREDLARGRVQLTTMTLPLSPGQGGASPQRFRQRAGPGSLHLPDTYCSASGRSWGGKYALRWFYFLVSSASCQIIKQTVSTAWSRF